MTPAERARQAIGLLDLTSLNPGDDETRIRALCQKARTPLGDVAAVCVWPRLIETARRALDGSSVKVAAVANFPAGAPDINATVNECLAIAAAGADEADVVFPYNSWLNGEFDLAIGLIKASRAACADKLLLKVILETGCLGRDSVVLEASRAVIAAGADFIKTSTGKTAISATPQAARAMLAAIRESGRQCGLKLSGGIRDAATATMYLDLTAATMGEDWISSRTFRFGASGVLDDLLAVADGKTATAGKSAY